LRSVSFAIGIGLNVAAFGQANSTGGAGTPSTSLTAADLNFAKEAAIGGQLEVDAGRIAERSWNNPRVKEFGARMARDHSAAGAQLKEIAAAKGITLPQDLDAKHQKLLDHLASLRGSEFDREYMRQMVEDHDEAVKLFENAAHNASDPQIKRFAEETSHTIQAHDKSVLEIAASMATGSSRPSTR
jgi:putative membrane protein